MTTPLKADRRAIEQVAVDVVTIRSTLSTADLAMKLVPLLDYSKELMEILRDSPDVLNGQTLSLYGKLVDNLAELRMRLKGKGMFAAKLGHLQDEDIARLKKEYAFVLTSLLTKIRKSVTYAREQAERVVVEEDGEGNQVERVIGFFDRTGIAWWYIRMDIPMAIGTAMYTVRKWGELLAYEKLRHGERPGGEEEGVTELEDYISEMGLVDAVARDSEI